MTPPTPCASSSYDYRGLKRVGHLTLKRIERVIHLTPSSLPIYGLQYSSAYLAVIVLILVKNESNKIIIGITIFFNMLIFVSELLRMCIIFVKKGMTGTPALCPSV